MSFEPYYHTPVSQYILNAFIWAGIMTIPCLIAVAALMLMDRKFDAKVLVYGIVFGVIIGGGGGAIGAGSGDTDTNASIVQSNVVKKYEVQSVTFDLTTKKGGGHGWTPNQSEPQQVIVKVNGISRIATLTQNPQTAEPTLVDVDTDKELVLHKDASRQEDLTR